MYHGEKTNDHRSGGGKKESGGGGKEMMGNCYPVANVLKSSFVEGRKVQLEGIE